MGWVDGKRGARAGRGREPASGGGRLRAEEIPARRDAVLDAAAVELTARGYEMTTMLAVAKAAGASKETLYSWFGSKEGLFAALIERNALRTNERISAALATDAPPEEVLIGFAVNLQRLLLGEAALAINRAAMNAPELATLLLEHGRFRTGALVECYLTGLMERGMIRIHDPASAFRILYGLIIEDRQIRALLGDAVLDDDARQSHAKNAVDRFLTIMRPVEEDI